MPRLPLPATLLAAVCLSLPLAALELTDLHLPLTRTEADAALSKDYRFRVLEDMTVRRSWELDNRTVSVDFAPKEGDGALLIFIDYKNPVSLETSHRDAGALLGETPGKWRRLLPRRSERLGMQVADGLKLEGGRYCFRELNWQGDVVRLAYYAGIPGDIRWNLADDNRQVGKTALGTRSTSGTASFLWRDEERRLEQAAEPAPTAAEEPSSAAVAEEVPAEPSAKPAKAKKQERPEEAPGIVAEVADLAGGLTPTHYALAGGVAALLLLMRVVARRREAKRRAMVADYIINRGPIPPGGRRRR